MTIVERVAKSVNREAVRRMREIEAPRATAERIAVLRQIVFRNAAQSRDLQALATEPEAAQLLISASNSADSFLVLGILHAAVDKRWAQVVQAGIRYFGEHPVADRLQELWDLTAGRTAV